MWSSKLIPFIIVVYLLLYIYYVPEDIEKIFSIKGFTPCNPNGWLQRMTIFTILWLYEYKELVIRKKLINFVIYDIWAGLIFNEIAQQNQQWNIWIFIGLAVTIIYPVYNQKLKK